MIAWHMSISINTRAAGPLGLMKRFHPMAPLPWEVDRMVWRVDYVAKAKETREATIRTAVDGSLASGEPAAEPAHPVGVGRVFIT